MKEDEFYYYLPVQVSVGYIVPDFIDIRNHNSRIYDYNIFNEEIHRFLDQLRIEERSEEIDNLIEAWIGKEMMLELMFGDGDFLNEWKSGYYNKHITPNCIYIV